MSAPDIAFLVTLGLSVSLLIVTVFWPTKRPRNRWRPLVIKIDDPDTLRALHEAAVRSGCKPRDIVRGAILRLAERGKNLPA